jgi:hypothetical protein
MSRFLIPQLIVLALCVMSAAQTPEQSPPTCPVISVLTPAGIVLPGGPVTYTALVSGGDPARLKYTWSVSKGKIVSGQGTESISTVFSGYPQITATVKVTGLPAGCTNIASAVYEYAVDPGPIELGQIAGPAYVINKRLLAKIGNEARKNPNAQLYVALQFEVGTPDNFMQTIRTRVADQLKKTKIEGSRITFVMADNGNKSVRFWLIPPGVENPAI